jgi:CRP-like cAMP-binding protein
MADQELLERLRSVPLFERLSNRELRDVMKRARVVDHPPGKEVVEEGGRAVGFHLILEGSATVLLGSKTRRTLGPGDYFGEISLIDGKPRSATVRADTDLRTLSLTAWTFKPLLDDHPAMAWPILLGLCEHLRTAEAHAD